MIRAGFMQAKWTHTQIGSTKSRFTRNLIKLITNIFEIYLIFFRMKCLPVFCKVEGNRNLFLCALKTEKIKGKKKKKKGKNQDKQPPPPPKKKEEEKKRKQV